MQFTISERLLLLAILPHEGDYTTVKIVRELREGLSFSEEDHKTLQLKHENNMVTWLPGSDKGKEVDVGAKAKEVIRNALMRASQTQKLTEAHIPLYETFVGTERD